MPDRGRLREERPGDEGQRHALPGRKGLILDRPAIKVRAAGILVRNGAILLLEHRKNGRRYWVLPGGGVETGETAARAVEREFFEELGIRVKASRLLFADEVVSRSRHNLDLYFSCRLAGRIRIRLEKGTAVAGFGFFTRAGLGRITVRPGVKPQLTGILASGRTRAIFSSFRRS